jgi:hypothetical protein
MMAVHCAEDGYHKACCARVQVQCWRWDLLGMAGELTVLVSMRSEIRSARESECYNKAQILANLMPDVEFFQNSKAWLHKRCVREHAVRSTRVRTLALCVSMGICVLRMSWWMVVHVS